MPVGYFRKFTLAALVLAASLIMEVGSASGEPNKVEKAAAAKVSIHEAIKIASEKVLGTVIGVELEQKHERLIWEVEIVTSEKAIMKIHIDAEIGGVIAVKEEKAKAKNVKRDGNHHTQQ